MKRTGDDDLQAAAHVAKDRFPARKRHFLRHQQPGADAVAIHPQDQVLIEHQLHKAICLALYAAGFSSVTRDALSSFRDLVQEYMQHFSLRVHESMRSCRRSSPIPQDFVHALASFDITASALIPDLSLPTPAKVAQAQILPNTDSSPSAFDLDTFISRDELSQNDPDHRYHIPSHFPIFPSKHAYKATPVIPSREHDALKIRERSTHEGTQAEQALRSLIAANKASEKRLREKGSQHQPQDQIDRDQVWNQALVAMGDEEQAYTAADQDDFPFGLDGSSDAPPQLKKEDMDTGVAGFANYDRIFWRRTKRKELMRVG